MDILIRNYMESDSIELLDLFNTTIRHVNKLDYNSEQLNAWAPIDRNLDEWHKSFEGSVTLVAILDSSIAGFCDFRKDGYINRFYVSSNYIRKGIGQALYKEVESSITNLNLSKITVDASITARPFFEKMGFGVFQEQKINLREVEFKNYKMLKKL